MSATTDQIEQDLQQDRENLRETLNAIEARMSPGALLDEAMAHLGTAPKQFAATLAGQVRDNPMPALLTGVGIAWMMMSNGRGGSSSGKSREAVDSFAAWKQPATGAAHAGSDGLGDDDYDAWTAHDRLQEAEWSCVRREGEDQASYDLRLHAARAQALQVQSLPDEDHQSFSDRLSGAADAVKEKGRAARDKFRRMADSARQGTGSVMDTARSAVGGAADRVKQAGGSLQNLHETNPFATAAMGVAVGAVLGALAPMSRREEDLLAPVADKGLAAGAEGGRKLVDTLTEKLDGNGASREESQQSAML